MSAIRLGSLALVLGAAGGLWVASAARAADPLPSPAPTQVVPRGVQSVPSPLPNPKATQQTIPRGDVRLVAPEGLSDSKDKQRPGAAKQPVKKSLIAPPSLVSQAPVLPSSTPPGLGRLDLNRASLEQIQRLPGVGLGLAPRILAGRPYRSLGDLARDGVPFTTIDSLSQQVELGP